MAKRRTVTDYGFGDLGFGVYVYELLPITNSYSIILFLPDLLPTKQKSNPLK